MFFKKNDGFTMIEVMITLVILMIGLMAMSLMQIGAIQGNSSAFSRSNANAVALTFLEELKRVPFDSVNLTAGGNLDAGAVPAGGTPNLGAADNTYSPAANDDLDGLDNMYTASGNYIVDRSGHSFQVFWNVANTTITVGGTTYTPYCTIRLYIYWSTSKGGNSLNITTVKYNNTEV